MSVIDDLENVFHSFKSIVTSKYFLLFQSIIELKMKDECLYNDDSYENFLKQNKLKENNSFLMYFSIKNTTSMELDNFNYSNVPIICIRYLQKKVDKLFPFMKKISYKRRINIHDVITKVRI